ncbi:MAG: hypothetical protein ACRD8W_11400 [Nitrososphaeraceae archaeon]
MIITAAVMATLIASVLTVSATNNSSMPTGNGTSGKSENAKSGINTTVCGPDAAHACQTSSGGQ